jgi:hypothetical protein
MKKLLIVLMCLSVLGFAACNRNQQENNGKKK